MANYNQRLPNYGDLIIKEKFLFFVKEKIFIDYDGWGNPVKNDLIDRTINISPSSIDLIPEDATHILWYNK